MKNNRFIIICTFFWIITALLFTEVQGQAVFNPRSPVNHPVLLSGSFGELRATHFHAGIDIKSKSGTVGDPIYSIEAGYVSKIVVRSDGYGNGMYITHPGGFISVYGHLDAFAAPFADFVKSTQYRNKSFEMEVDLQPEQFPVTKGQMLGKMGNTGTSFGPHLHFEVRNAKTGKPVNPLFYGFKPPDKKPPVISGIKIVRFTEDSVEYARNVHTAISQGNGKYKLKTDTLEVDAGRIGIEFSGYDQLDGAANKNGIVELQMKVNGKTVYHYRVDSFSFSEAQHIYAHVNYTSFFQDKSKYQHCYILPGDPLKIYKMTESDEQILTLLADKKEHVEIFARDFHNNESKIQFWLKPKPVIDKDASPLIYNYVLEPGKQKLIDEKSVFLHFSDSSLYNKMYLHIDQSDTTEAPFHSPYVFINNGNKLFKNKVDLYIRQEGIPPEKLLKTVVVDCGSGKKYVSYGGEIFDGYILARINRFGTYALYIDTIPPTISSKNFKANMSAQKSVSFTIDDNLISENRANELRYHGYIDDKWVLFEYDKKSRTITHTFEKDLPKGEHILRIELRDGKNNLSVFKEKFIR